MKKGFIQMVRELAAKTPYFTIYDVMRILKKEKYSYLVLNILTKKRRNF